MGPAGPVADWKDAQAYAPLLAADRSIFAWEWLRREPAYRAAAVAARGERGAAAAGAWGLQRFEDPDLAAPASRPLWHSEAHRQVLRSRALPVSAPQDAVDLGTLSAVATVARSRHGREHWLFSDGLRAIRLDVDEGSAVHGPVELHYRLFGRASLRGALLALRRLAALLDTGRFQGSLHAPERKAHRWILALRASDALAAGATQREVAAELLSDRAGEARWRVDEASLRSQVQRLMRAARGMTGGGYRLFLD